ncbi:MAG: hypothetical protein JHC87_01820 [Thermoleophilaceae bacterium]|nr:hypothetical protein [Thermoleophilaceae bacterium]
MAIIKNGVIANRELGVDVQGTVKVHNANPDGYVAVQFVAVNFTAAVAEGLVTLTPVRDGVAGVASTSMAVTAGKRLRILGVAATTRNAGAAAQGIQCRVRINPSGAATVGSQVIASFAVGTTLAIANVSDTATEAWATPSIDVSAAAQIAVSQIGTATAGNDVVIYGYEYTPST